ncbi:MAG: TetR/AcrR family transcriptional regulator [Bryobacter sp.]|jgi:AcrR family transcriptional regulator|nr:TetR/AcrR family transcriptional regulator [Bryobacter sp. CoA8 C33]
MVQKLRRPSKKKQLLEAAIHVAAQGGIEALTIESLAAAAGVTKGGVQYHFRSKDVLYEELLDYALRLFDLALEEKAPPGSKPGTWLHAYVDLSLGSTTDYDKAVATLLAGIPVNDERAGPYRRFAARWKERANADGRDAATNTIVRLAADSVWMERAYLSASSTEIARLKQRLHQLIDEAQQ